MIFETKGITRKYFYDIAFLIKAISTDETRYFMHYINVETKKNKDDEEMVYCVTTDGRIMHIVEYKKEDSPLENGFYSVSQNKKDIILLNKSDESVNFPNWSKIVEQMDNHLKVIENFELRQENGFTKLVFILNNLGYHIKFNYLQSIIDLCSSPSRLLHDTCDIYLNSYRQGDGVKFINGNCTAIIMPMNIKEIIPVIYNAYTKLDNSLKELNKTEVLFEHSILRKKKYLWEE